MLMLDAGAGALDYFPCRYGASKSLFRGPLRDLSRPYVAMLGGSPTFGKYVDHPYPALVERALGLPVANLGGLNAGPDFYLSDPGLMDVAAGAQLAVVQITGAEAVSNPFYSVHGRRNDRFLAATPALRPLTPVHPAARTLADGTLSLAWTRRARGAWGWPDGVETPLNEETEAYTVGLGPVAAPLLQWEVSQPLLALPPATLSTITAAHAGQSLWVRQIGRHALSDPLHLVTLA